MPLPDGTPRLPELAAQLDAVWRGLDRQQDRRDLGPHHRAAVAAAALHVTAAARLLRDSVRGVAPTSAWPLPFPHPTIGRKP